MNERIYKRGTFSIGLLTGVLLASLVLVLIKDINPVSSAKPIPKDPLIESFKASETTLKKVEIKGWVLVNNKYEAGEKLEEYFKAINSTLSLPLADLKLEKHNEENFQGITAEGRAGEYEVQLLLQSVKGTAGSERAPETYIIATITNQKLNPSYKKVYQELKTSLQQLASEPQVSVNIIGESNLALEQAARENALDKVLKEIQAEKISIITNGNLTSVTGITPLIKETIKVGMEQINVNAAYRYNFLEKKTYFYLGSPIISTEY